MPKILIVDDDFYYSSNLRDYLSRNFTYHVDIANDIKSAINLINEFIYDIIILDIMMPLNDSSVYTTGNTDGYWTGVFLFKHVKTRLYKNNTLTIFITNHEDYIIENFIEANASECADGLTYAVAKKSSHLFKIVAKHIKLYLYNKPNILIVHGHEYKTRDMLEAFLMDSFNDPHIVIMEKEGIKGETLIEKFEKLVLMSDIALVLLSSDNKRNNPRTNVVFELGFLLGSYGRLKNKIIILKNGSVTLPSDIHGLEYFDISNGIDDEVVRKGLLKEINSKIHFKKAIL